MFQMYSDDDDQLSPPDDLPIVTSWKNYTARPMHTFIRHTLPLLPEKKSELKLSTKTERYQRIPDLNSIPGFVVNVHDATNYDIDLQIPPVYHSRYLDVIHNTYTFINLGNDFIENGNLQRVQDCIPQSGKALRCRLRGIGINQDNSSIHSRNSILLEIKQLLDRSNAFVICTLSDIDVYQRLLVDIKVILNDRPIELKSFLLERYSNLYYQYGQRN